MISAHFVSETPEVRSVTEGVTAVTEIDAFHWLLVLGFPPEVAALAAGPDATAE
jgi:hypothetical protein